MGWAGRGWRCRHVGGVRWTSSFGYGGSRCGSTRPPRSDLKSTATPERPTWKARGRATGGGHAGAARGPGRLLLGLFWGADWEQRSALNGTELHPTAVNCTQRHPPPPPVLRLPCSETVQRPVSHRRGRWFDPSIAHCKCLQVGSPSPELPVTGFFACAPYLGSSLGAAALVAADRRWRSLRLTKIEVSRLPAAGAAANDRAAAPAVRRRAAPAPLMWSAASRTPATLVKTPNARAKPIVERDSSAGRAERWSHVPATHRAAVGVRVGAGGPAHGRSPAARRHHRTVAANRVAQRRNCEAKAVACRSSSWLPGSALSSSLAGRARKWTREDLKRWWAGNRRVTVPGCRPGWARGCGAFPAHGARVPRQRGDAMCRPGRCAGSGVVGGAPRRW